MNHIKILILLFFLNVNLFSQYQVKSKYLIDPDLAILYVDSCAQFWQKAWDNNYGGFYTNISKTGTLISSWGTNKDMLTQSRNAYGLTKAFMLTGNENYLELANKALQFMYQHAWDKINGGWFNNLNSVGNPMNTSDNKTAFYQHYALLGISAFFEATRDTATWNWLNKGLQNNETHLWDKDENNFGYFDYGNFKWTNRYNKSFNATVDAITTHILYLYLITNDDFYKTRLEELSDNIISHLVLSMNQQAIGFAEKYNMFWQPLSDERLTIMGHVLKSAWCLARIYQIEPDESLLINAKKLFNHVIEKGYDKKFGGPYKDYDRITGQMQMWGNPDTAKAWWQMEQAVVAGLQLFDLTQDEFYLKIADETLDFFMKYFVDHVYGEVYENRTRRGEETWGEHKGNGAKAAYHSIELGFYNYVYGNLFYKNLPVKLYYKIMPVDFSRILDLMPLAISPSKIKISSVKLNGQEFSAVNGTKINLSPNEGGKFEVVFERTNPSESEALSDNAFYQYILNQNYPNPFNSITNISYSIPKSEMVNLSVYDILGNRITVLENSYKMPGFHSVAFNAENLPSGIYFCRFITNRMQKTIKIMLLR
jgi:mannose/cellobiose epimerase-like protein (N-acyl-D-glucosamine 2-epimerase family)